MSTSFERCDKSVDRLALEILEKYPKHAELLECGAAIDFVFASSDDPMRRPLKKNGVPAAAIARNITLKDRAMGRGDAEVAIDREWWNAASDKEKESLLDHELFHFGVDGGKRDDLGRPVIFIRHHDFDVGWFKHIAKRHGMASVECKQAKIIWDEAGQLFWPEVFQPDLPNLEAQKPKRIRAEVAA